MMRLSADYFLGESSLGAAGASELSWPAPVRAGDTLTLQIEVLSMREQLPTKFRISGAHHGTRQPER